MTRLEELIDDFCKEQCRDYKEELKPIIAESRRVALSEAIEDCHTVNRMSTEDGPWSTSAHFCAETIGKRLKAVLPSEVKLPYCACCQNTGTDPGDSAMTCPECQGTVREG